MSVLVMSILSTIDSHSAFGITAAVGRRLTVPIKRIYTQRIIILSSCDDVLRTGVRDIKWREMKNSLPVLLSPYNSPHSLIIIGIRGRFCSTVDTASIFRTTCMDSASRT